MRPNSRRSIEPPGPARYPLAPTVAALAAALLLAPAAVAAEPAPIARLSVFTGPVQVLRAGQPQTVFQDMPLLSDDVVASNDGRAIVIFDDRSELRLRPRTRVRIAEQAEKRDVEVFFGRLWAFVASRRDRPTNFAAGGTIAAVRGTTLEIFRDERSGEVFVGLSDGEVEITIRLGDGTLLPLTLRPGKKFKVSPDGAIEESEFEAGEIADPRHEGEHEGEGEREHEGELHKELLQACTGCQVLDIASGRCMDEDLLCQEPCFVDRRCQSGVCTGGRRVVSAEDPNCP
jgi:hypothetical protein